MNEEEILKDLEWTKSFDYADPIRMAELMILHYADSLNGYNITDETWTIEKLKHWCEVKERLKNE